MKPTPVQELARARWRESGLSDTHAAKLKLKALDASEVTELAPNFKAAGALKIPYFDLDGKVTDFYRIRYLEPLPGFAGAIKSPQRYDQPAGSMLDVYLPPLLDESWADIAKNTTRDILVTEGEFKAGAGCAVGLAVAAFGGVSSWTSSKRLWAMLPVLEEIEWKDRRVYIVFDSDITHKPEVLTAQRKLAGALLSKGALPSLVLLPPGPQDTKQGLDDFLIAHGGEALLTLMAEALVFPEATALWGMNEKLVFVRDPGLVVERDTGRAMRPDTFERAIYSNVHYMTTNAKGTLVKKPLASRWMEWEHRFECNKVCYEPGKERIYNGDWNVWGGWGCDPRPGDIGPWNWLLDFIFKADLPARQWFEKWCAYPIQHPGAKLYAAVVLWSVAQGMGKTLVGYTLMKIYGRNAIEVNEDALQKDFNSWAKCRQFIIGDEIAGGQARREASKLKSMISRQEITVNEKFVPEYTVRDCLNYLFTSQHPDAVVVEAHDRRYFVKEIAGQPADRVRYEEYDRWLKGDGPRHLFHHLKTLPLGNFNPREHAPMTADKGRMMATSRSEVQQWVAQLAEDPVSMLKPFGDKIAKSCDLYTAKQLLRAFDPEGRSRYSTTGMGIALIAGGLRHVNDGKGVWTKAGAKNLYCVRNPDKWMRASQRTIAEHYDFHFIAGGKK